MSNAPIAADLPVKAVPPPIAYYDWSGIYLGLSLGGIWAEVDRFYPNFDLVHLVPQTFTSRNKDGIVGFHGGAQWQWGPWVIGFEVAYSKGWRDISGTVSLSPPEPFTTLGAYNKISNLLTAGPRLGYAWDRVMVYATGGYAGGTIDGQYVCTATGVAVAPGPACGVFAPTWLPSMPPAIPFTTAGMRAPASNTWCTRARSSMSFWAPNTSTSS